MLENVEAVGEGAVTPEVFLVALGAVVDHIFDDDAFEPEVGEGQQAGREQALERHPFAVLVDVADDDGNMAARFQKAGHIAIDFQESFQEMLHIAAVAQIGGVIAETDDVVIGWVHHQKLDAPGAGAGQPAGDFGGHGGGAAVADDDAGIAGAAGRITRPGAIAAGRSRMGMRMVEQRPAVAADKLAGIPGYRRRQFYADVAAAQAGGLNGGGAAADERIQNDVAGSGETAQQLVGYLGDEVAVVAGLVGAAGIAGVQDP